MKRKSWPVLVAALAALVWLGSAVMAGGGTWISDDGKIHGIDRDDVFVFNLADLAEGETRTFGTGEDAITATRKGDSVALVREGDKGRHGLDMSCDVSGDDCIVVTFPDSDDVALRLIKNGECEGADDCTDVKVQAFHGGTDGVHRVMVRKILSCEGENEEDCADIDVQAFDVDGSMASALAKIEILADGDDPEAIFVHGGVDNVFVDRLGDHVTLRCSEGDSSIRVEKEEADDTFLCPKHSTPMERSKHPFGHVFLERKGN